MAITNKTLFEDPKKWLDANGNPVWDTHDRRNGARVTIFQGKLSAWLSAS